jgi:proteasome beta subunit
VGSDFAVGGRLPAAFMNAGSSSFTDFLTGYAPGLLPGGDPSSAAAGTRLAGPGLAGPGPAGAVLDGIPHGTTIVAVVCEDGVVMAGDRRATAGNMIAQRDIEKVFRSDDFSCIGFSGVAGPALELVRLFQVELEHYEKLEGRALTLEGKANRLATMVRGNLPAAMQGLVVVPLFAGYDEDAGTGRIFSYDPTGGRYEEHLFQGIGSGSIFAKGALKKLYREGMPSREAVVACMQSLYDAADDDSATGGPDLARRIFPIVATVTADGFRRLPDAETAEIAEAVVAGRLRNPDGPSAPLRDPAG